MAAKEVIHFRLPAQLTSCSLFPVLLSIESVSESRSYRKIPEWGLSLSPRISRLRYPCAPTNGMAQPTLLTDRNASIRRVVSLS